MSVKVPQEMWDQAEGLRKLSDEEVKIRYEAIGSPKPQEYRLQLYWGSSGGGWRQIDNSQHPDKDSNPIIFWLKSAHDAAIDSGFMRACILAHMRELRKLEIPPEAEY